MSDSSNLWFWGGTAVIPGGKPDRIEDAAIGITGGKITYVGTRKDARPTPGARKLDSMGCIVMPGLVNAHTHVGMTLLRGYGDDLPLERWLRERIFPAEQKWVSPEFVYWGTLLGCAEMIRAGITSFNDMYYYEDQSARASAEAGMRMVAGQTLTEESDVDNTGADLTRSFDRFREAVAEYPLVVPALAPHAIYSVSAESWKRVIAYAGKHGLRINTHLSEVKSEVDNCLKQYGKTPVQALGEMGLWEQKVNVAHAIWLNPEDIATLGKHRVGVTYNPESNMKLGTAVAPMAELRAAGAVVGLGTDGAASNNNMDLLVEADFAAKLQSFKYGPGKVPAQDVIAMLTREGACSIGLEGVGTLEVDAAADVIAVDVSGPHAIPMYDPYSHLVYSASGRDVRHTVANGQVLMENKNLMTLDEQEILREAVSWGRRIMA